MSRGFRWWRWHITDEPWVVEDEWDVSHSLREICEQAEMGAMGAFLWMNQK